MVATMGQFLEERKLSHVLLSYGGSEVTIFLSITFIFSADIY